MEHKIEMVDLYGQYLKIQEEVDAAIREVIRSSVFIKGGKVNEFEQHLATYLNTGVISCANGTDALQLAFMALDLHPGDEVITTPFTFVATVEVLALLQLKPVFVDVNPGTFNMDVMKIEQAVTPRTKVILPVHLFGQHADMETILSIAGKHNLVVIDDAAQSMGASYIFSDGRTQKSGTLGTLTTTSFFPSKNLGAMGDAGAVFTSHPELGSRVRSIANHGMKVRYYYDRIGLNSRLDSLQAAILDVKLKYLDQFVEARQKAASWYDEKLNGVGDVIIPERVPFSTHAFHQYTIRTKSRNDLQEFLKEKGIPSMIYYPKAIHMQEAYEFLGYKKGDFPVSEELTKTVLSLPMHTEMNEQQLSFISDSIRQFFDNQQ